MTIKDFKVKIEEMLQNEYAEDSEIKFYVNGNDGAYDCDIEFKEGEFQVCLSEECKMDFCDNHLNKNEVREIIEELKQYL